MYQGPPIKMWLLKTFYGGLYSIASRPLWKKEAPEQSIVAAHFFVNPYLYRCPVL